MMKKTAMIIAMSCALLCPSMATARKCASGENVAWVEGSIQGQVSPKLINEVRLSGVTDLVPRQLTESYFLPGSQLVMGYEGRRPVMLSAVREVPSENSVCIEFSNGQAEAYMSTLIERISGESGPQPVVCIDANGVVTSKLHVIASLRSPLVVRIKTVHRDSRDAAVIFEALTGACER